MPELTLAQREALVRAAIERIETAEALYFELPFCERGKIAKAKDSMMSARTELARCWRDIKALLDAKEAGNG